jgi:glutamate dehydrogenase (NAD(P)+)
MLVPAALGHVITPENAAQIKAPIIVEAANGPVHPDADDILVQAGKTVVPDILVNAGGVTASYFEWVQNRQHYQWGLNRVRQELDSVMANAFESVWAMAEEKRVTLRTAAYIIGIGRVGRATILGGIS